MPERILIVDNDPSRLAILQSQLAQAGFPDSTGTTDARRALSLFRDLHPALLLLDLHMERLDGITLLQQILPRVPHVELLPVLVTSTDVSPELRLRALQAGAGDFLPAGASTGELHVRVHNLLHVRALHMSLEERIRARMLQLEQAEVEVAKRLAFAAEVRDYPDGSHPTRVGRMSAAIAAELGMSEPEVELIGLAAPLHDIGKLALPDAILMKPGALTPAEWDVVRSHTTQGARMLTGTASRILQAAEEIALYHHENWDGSGYTPGLAGREIPVAGRIVSIADVFDALMHRRAYKPAWSLSDAVAFIESQRGVKFDPDVVDAFHRMVADPAAGGVHTCDQGDRAVDVWEDFMSSVADTFQQTFARAMQS